MGDGAAEGGLLATAAAVDDLSGRKGEIARPFVAVVLPGDQGVDGRPFRCPQPNDLRDECHVETAAPCQPAA